VERVLSGIDSRLSVHDFRMVTGHNNVNLVFDIDMPYDCKMTVEDIVKILEPKYKKEKKKHHFVITVDRY
jgi:hypothetical protein